MENKTVVIDMGRVEDWPITHLRTACKKNKVKGYTKMSREELVYQVKQLFKKLDALRNTGN